MNNEEKFEELDPFYVSHYMTNASLQYENVFDGLAKSLYLAKLYFDADEVVLYKQNNDNYDFVNRTPNAKINPVIIDEIMKSKKINFNKSREFNLNEQDINDITFYPISFRDINYVAIIVNKKNNRNIDIIMDTLKIILDRMELYEKMNMLSYVDGLTKLDNRLAFNNKFQEYNKDNKHLVFALLDLFRLKYVNDELGHDIGDLYIKSAADTLKKYFPKFNYSNKFDVASKNETGDNIYRIGGDEFVLMSENKSLEEVNQLLKYVVEEVKNVDLGVQLDSPIGINYGSSERISDEDVQELYKLADDRLSQDKRRMYEELDIDRRK